MEKKKLKLSISGSSKKTFNSIEQAKTKSKNTVVIEKKNLKFQSKSQFSRQSNNTENYVANKISLSKIEADGLIMSARDKVYKDWEMENGEKKIKVINNRKFAEDF